MTVEAPMPKVRALCRVCGVTAEQVANGYVLVSPSGTAHLGHWDIIENTVCGKDATPDGWWWPL